MASHQTAGFPKSYPIAAFPRTVRRGYLLLAVPVTSCALALGYWVVQVWGSLRLLPCAGPLECGGAPPILSWPIVLLLLLGVYLFRLGARPARHGPVSRTPTASDRV
jgi:hypothetical protein